MNTKENGLFDSIETEQVCNALKSEFGFELNMKGRKQSKPYDTVYLRKYIKESGKGYLEVCVRKYLISAYFKAGQERTYLLDGQHFYGTFDMVNYLKMNIPFRSLIGLVEKPE